MIIFICGSINAGKSTVAKLLAKKLGNTANIETDKLRDFIRWMPLDESIELNLENTCSLIANFAKRNINAVIPYVLSEQNYHFLISKLQPLNQEVFFFGLNPPLNEALKNRGRRKLNDWQRERVAHHYQIGLNSPSFATVLDTQGDTPNKTVQKILTLLKGKHDPSNCE